MYKFVGATMSSGGRSWKRKGFVSVRVNRRGSDQCDGKTRYEYMHMYMYGRMREGVRGMAHGSICP